jgi:hypothetical protein
MFSRETLDDIQSALKTNYRPNGNDRERKADDPDSLFSCTFEKISEQFEIEIFQKLNFSEK